ncbi:hypothetical protein D3C76_1682430 [compost metagenome]
MLTLQQRVDAGIDRCQGLAQVICGKAIGGHLAVRADQQYPAVAAIQLARCGCDVALQAGQADVNAHHSLGTSGGEQRYGDSGHQGTNA